MAVLTLVRSSRSCMELPLLLVAAPSAVSDAGESADDSAPRGRTTTDCQQQHCIDFEIPRCECYLSSLTCEDSVISPAWSRLSHLYGCGYLGGEGSVQHDHRFARHAVMSKYVTPPVRPHSLLQVRPVANWMDSLKLRHLSNHILHIVRLLPIINNKIIFYLGILRYTFEGIHN